MFFAACEKSPEAPAPVAESDADAVILPEGLTPRIGYAEAAGIARQAVALLESSAATRTSRSRRTLDPANVKYFVLPATRSGEPADTLMYVFNFADSAGFALVSAIRASDQLLAVTEKGSYAPGADVSSQVLDWSAIRRHVKRGTCGSDCTGHRAIG